jgi:molybdopterin-guanine dinucleotide biosynthesis protein A
MSEGVSCIVLAGGKSSRMGTDKAFVSILGRSLIEEVLARVQGLGEETLIVTNRPDDYHYLGLRLVADVIPGMGVLGGIYTALYAARMPYALVVACDMPFLNRELLSYLVSLREGQDAVVPHVGGLPEPVHAVYARTCLEAIARNLSSGALKIAEFYPQVRVRYVDAPEIERFDPQYHSFVNVNTPEELARARKLAG